MRLTTKQEILKSLCKAAGIKGVGFAKAKLEAIEASNRKQAVEKIARAFGFDHRHIVACL